jgi:hypothetical protein
MAEESELTDAELDERYSEQRRKFFIAVADCECVSSATAGRQTDERRWWTSVIYARLCTTAISTLKVLPGPALGSREADPLDKHWDFTAVAALMRTLFENHLTLYYLCLEDVDEDEWRSRLNLMQLHDFYTRKKVFDDLMPEAKPKPEDERRTIDDLTTKLHSRKYFQSLELKKQSRFLRGDRSSFLSHEEILSRMGIPEPKKQIAVFRWWSTHVHSYPMSYYRMPEQGRGVGRENPIEKGYILSAMVAGTEFIEEANAGVRRVFPDISSRDTFVADAVRQTIANTWNS